MGNPKSLSPELIDLSRLANQRIRELTGGRYAAWPDRELTAEIAKLVARGPTREIFDMKHGGAKTTIADLEFPDDIRLCAVLRDGEVITVLAPSIANANISAGTWRTDKPANVPARRERPPATAPASAPQLAIVPDAPSAAADPVPATTTDRDELHLSRLTIPQAALGVRFVETAIDLAAARRSHDASVCAMEIAASALDVAIAAHDAARDAITAEAAVVDARR